MESEKFVTDWTLKSVAPYNSSARYKLCNTGKSIQSLYDMVLLLEDGVGSSYKKLASSGY